MKIKKLFSGLLLTSLILGVAACGEETPTTNTPTVAPTVVPTQVELKFKSAVLAPTENEGELNLKAEINGTVGKIYAIITNGEATPTADDIVNGSVAGVEVVRSVNSADATKIETLLTGLDKGVDYYAYFVIIHENSKSNVVSKMATTFKNPVDMGEGTPESPYKISTIEDLEAIGLGIYDAYNLDFSKNACYVLTNDIDLSEKYGEGKGNWTPLNLDNGGVLDGAGYTISGLYINDTQSQVSLGLFERINKGATVKNITLENSTIICNGYVEQGKIDGTSVGTSGGIYVGTLTGDLKGTIDNIRIKNTNISSTGSRIGGVVGRAYSDVDTAIVINNVKVEGANISGISRIGGIVGLVDNKDNQVFTLPTFTNLYFEGTVQGRRDTFEHEGQTAIVEGQYIGGLAGYFRTASIKNASVNATVSGVTHVGGAVGFMQRRSKTSTYVTSLENVIVKANVCIETGSNCGIVVGNKSAGNDATEELVFASNVYYAEGSTIKVAGNDQVIADFNFSPTAIPGTFVSSADLNAAWYQTNLPTFDFETLFELNENNLPILK